MLHLGIAMRQHIVSNLRSWILLNKEPRAQFIFTRTIRLATDLVHEVGVPRNVSRVAARIEAPSDNRLDSSGCVGAGVESQLNSRIDEIHRQLCGAVPDVLVDERMSADVA